MQAVQLTSKNNPRLKKLRRALQGGQATENGLVFAEGPHLFEEALTGGWEIEQVFVSPDGGLRYQHLLEQTRAEVIELSPNALSSISSTETTQGILSLLRPRSWTWEDFDSDSALAVVLDGIQDPGNAGTVVRSAEAFGATGVIFLKGCVRVANTKFLRATAGSIFRMPYLELISAGDVPQHLVSAKIYALVANCPRMVTAVDWRTTCALVVGNEGAGVSREMLRFGTGVSIPTERVESLNAAVACSVALFHAHEQRTSGREGSHP
jgi:TrmH family RNA methyltransferase